ncbi:hypothetical protein [Pyrobaculum islandicum]|nr:hypothetical protein [Pyrobaculum islandicum]
MGLVYVDTVNTCPRCGGVLELVEDDRFIWFGCRRCMRYVKREKREVTKRYVDYVKRKFDWRGMMNELYELYLKS